MNTAFNKYISKNINYNFSKLHVTFVLELQSRIYKYLIELNFSHHFISLIQIEQQLPRWK